MKNGLISFGFLGLLIIFGLSDKQAISDSTFRIEKADGKIDVLVDKSLIKNGDLIFQASTSDQSKAIQLATNSKYSHCGIIFIDNGHFVVFEAVQPVKSTSLDQWIARCERGHYVIKRLKKADQVLTSEAIQKMKIEGEKFKGKDYDLTFEWSDDRIYCSELVWKVYQRATGIEIGNLEKLRNFDLSSETVKSKLSERFGDNIPMDEPVISPAAIFNSSLLMTIAEN